MSLIERANRAQRICNDVLTHKRDPKPMPVPASDNDDDVFVWDAWKDCVAEIERLTVEVSNLKLANEEARKTIDRLNTLIPRDSCSSGRQCQDGQRA